MSDKKNDLRERTTEFALRIVKLYKSLPKSTEPKSSANKSCVQAHRLERSSVKASAQNRIQTSSTSWRAFCRKPTKPPFGWNYS